MAGLTKGRRVLEREGRTVTDPVAANVKIFTGAITVLDGGYLKPGFTGVGLVARGIAMSDVDNTAGAAGAVNADSVRKGAYQFGNHAADLVGRAHIGGIAYIVDDQTVAATNGTNTRSAAGKIVDVDAQGVWVEFV